MKLRQISAEFGTVKLASLRFYYSKIEDSSPHGPSRPWTLIVEGCRVCRLRTWNFNRQDEPCQIVWSRVEMEACPKSCIKPSQPSLQGIGPRKKQPLHLHSKRLVRDLDGAMCPTNQSGLCKRELQNFSRSRVLHALLSLYQSASESSDPAPE